MFSFVTKILQATKIQKKPEEKKFPEVIYTKNNFDKIKALPSNRFAVIEDKCDHDFYDFNLHIYDASNFNKPLCTIERLDLFRQFTFSPDFNVVYCPHIDGVMRAWNLANNICKPECVAELKLENNDYQFAAVSNDCLAITYRSHESTGARVDIWNYMDGSIESIHDNKLQNITHIMSIPNKKLFVCTDGVSASLWNLNKERINHWSLNGQARQFCVLPDDSGFVHIKNNNGIQYSSLHEAKNHLIDLKINGQDELVSILPTGELVTRCRQDDDGMRKYTFWNIEDIKNPSILTTFTTKEHHDHMTVLSNLQLACSSYFNIYLYDYKPIKNLLNQEKNRLKEVKQELMTDFPAVPEVIIDKVVSYTSTKKYYSYQEKLKLFSKIDPERLEQLKSKEKIEVGDIPRKAMGRVSLA